MDLVTLGHQAGHTNRHLIGLRAAAREEERVEVPGCDFRKQLKCNQVEIVVQRVILLSQ